MSVWLPPALPPTVEDIWLPVANIESSISPHQVSLLEEALKERREAIRNKSCPDPIGTRTPTPFRPASTVETVPEEHDQDDMEVEREEEELASDEISDDAQFGTPMADIPDHDPDAHDMQEVDDDLDEDEEDEEDNDDDLTAYL